MSSCWLFPWVCRCYVVIFRLTIKVGYFEVLELKICIRGGNDGRENKSTALIWSGFKLMVKSYILLVAETEDLSPRCQNIIFLVGGQEEGHKHRAVLAVLDEVYWCLLCLIIGAINPASHVSFAETGLVFTRCPQGSGMAQIYRTWKMVKWINK